MKQYDAIIIGARIAGSATAIRLAKNGRKVLLIDKVATPHDVVSTHFMNPRGMTYLKNLGVLDELLKETPAFRHFDVQVDDIALGGQVDEQELKKRLAHVHPKENFDLELRYSCIRRPLLDGALQKKALESGVEFRSGLALENISLVEIADETGVEITFHDGSKARAKLLIGADGKKSKVAEILDIKKQEERFACTFACYTYFEGLKLPNAIMKKRDRMTFAAVPTSFGRTMILVFGPDKFYSRFLENREKNYFKSIDRIDPQFAALLKRDGKRVEAFRSTVDQQAFMRKRPTGPIALLGDAHCFKDQCTANGMSHALRDAFLLSEESEKFFAGKSSLRLVLNDFEDRRYLDLFRFYEFTGSQAEMNPIRAEEERLYRAISEYQDEKNMFIGLYFDVVEVKSFFNARRIEKLTQSVAAVRRSETQLARQYQNPFEETPATLPLQQTCFDYSAVSGPNLFERTEPYFSFYKRRENAGAFQYARTLHRFPGTTTSLSDDSNRFCEGINFASQDYLGLGQDSEIHEAALEAFHTFGPHSAGSPMVIGNTLISKKLENELKNLTGKKHVLLFPTGYAAGMGSILGIVKPEDHIVMDRLSHACLQQGARAATRKIHKFAHLDVAAARATLKEIRSTDARNGILLVTEGLFSMDADSPDLRAFQEIADEFDAYLFVDVAHDLGASGPKGTGQIGLQGMYGKIDLVMGSFSKSFASNGGFLATDSEALLHYLRMFSTPHLFSNALSPIQAGVALKAAQIMQSPKGDELRGQLSGVVNTLRTALTNEGLACLGQASPIVPVFIGSEAKARVSHRKMMENNLATMIIEYPIVPLGASRFRLQVMASHTNEQALETARIMGRVNREISSVEITTRDRRVDEEARRSSFSKTGLPTPPQVFSRDHQISAAPKP